MALSASVTWKLAAFLGVVAGGIAIFFLTLRQTAPVTDSETPAVDPAQYKPRRGIDTSGFGTVIKQVPAWNADSSLARVATLWGGVGLGFAAQLDVTLANPSLPPEAVVQAQLAKAAMLNYEGEAEKAYETICDARRYAERVPQVAMEWRYTTIFYQGVTALRRGENDNCVMCRGESSCILPIAASAKHEHPVGSRLAIQHFTEYLDRFPDDLEVRWLLNVAHMTLGEHPQKVDARYLIPLDLYLNREHAIGNFRDIGHIVGINRLNQAGGAILDDFDNDGNLDIVFTTMDPTQPLVFYRNLGNGRFEDRTKAAGLNDQLGGLYCVQADYNNDGWLDILVVRGAWLNSPLLPSLLRNNGNGTFTDVTRVAGLAEPMNAITAQWADFDNDGWLDLLVCGETTPNRLYRNRGNGTFAEVPQAGLPTRGVWKGAAWLDYNQDRFVDVFLTDISGAAKLYRNNGNSTFTDVTANVGIDGPKQGFSCWAWDYDNDGWPDIFATSYDRTLGATVKGLLGQSHDRETSRIYKNLNGKGFRDVTKDVGLDAVYVTMGSNFGDFDNDGWLDCYLGTGDPELSMLVPNRMLRNLGGKKFADITGSSGTGHLQKGHGVACGDWDRDGNTDIVVQMGGAINGDRYHNILFQNPGQGNNWLNVKLVGITSNRSAIGAQIKVVITGDNPRTIHRTVSSGSSFGANSLEQNIGLGKADRVATLEVFWPATGNTQVFRGLPANRYFEIAENAKEPRDRNLKTINWNR